MLFKFCSLILFVAWAQAASRTSPPSGAIVVRRGTTTSGEFSTIKAALASLPKDSSARSIFLYPGTYNEQVLVDRTGPTTVYGSTDNTDTYTANGATIAFSMGADQAGSNDASGTLRIHSDNVKIYNVNIKNTRGAGVQAIAVSVQGNKVGFYGCALYGYQDTLLANTGNQVYLKGYIEGKTDFIFGNSAQAYFGGNTIAVSGAGFITADGRDDNGAGIYVFNSNTIVQAPGAESGTSGGYYFGRPWRPYARVIFKNTIVNVAPHPGLWSLWNGNPSSVSNTLFADYNTGGSAAGGITRDSFAKLLSATEANKYTIATTVGSDYASWVDSAYVV
ncbi:pectinesterase [Marasmius fiardii PR-910]|nr:pectinesterase [Marasmius fiardii PR-910]